ncbi:OmpA family protein [Acinetobacter baumannii]|nr:OmpA family protein [Acinetobacter baumannii]
MNKLRLLIIAGSIGLSACAADNYARTSNLRFQEKNIENVQVLKVKRDDKLCAGDTAEKQNCPINFYIDNIQSGSFYINNTAQYYLKPETYNLKVKNCTSQECRSCDIDIQENQLVDNDFILSLDEKGEPYFINGGKELICSNKELSSVIELSADALFVFNGSGLKDVLPEGRKKIIDLASKISNEFISVKKIKLIGHTDRLGNDNYNQQLGQNRAETVRNLLIENGISEEVVNATSMGETQPITDGCPNVKPYESLKSCLQPDRRVTVEITGITK